MVVVMKTAPAKERINREASLVAKTVQAFADLFRFTENQFNWLRQHEEAIVLRLDAIGRQLERVAERLDEIDKSKAGGLTSAATFNARDVARVACAAAEIARDDDSEENDAE